MTPRGGHRLFVAVDPPAESAAELAGWARAARRAGLRPLPPANVHLTLAFLGYRASGDVDRILAALTAAAAEFTLGGPRGPIVLATAGPVWLPKRRPRALALDVDDPSGALAELHAAVASTLARAIGWTDERPRFRPHLTAGRISGPADPGALPPAPQMRFAVDRMSLYRSFLEPGGARYEALGTAAFASIV